jgi:hypothetical protein
MSYRVIIYVGAVAYVETKCLLKVKLLGTDKDPCKILAIGAKLLSSRRIYSRLFLHRIIKYKRDAFLASDKQVSAKTLVLTAGSRRLSR